MSRIYPERLPESVLHDPRRAAERAVYEALHQLPDSFTVFYSVSWLARRTDGDAQDGEADFVVAHPELGVAVLEVKGGLIRFDATTGLWTSQSRSGEVFTIKDPVAQARGNKHALLQKLQDLSEWPRRWLTVGHAVVFPDIHAPTAPLRVDLPPEIVLDRLSLENCEAALRRVFTYFHGAEGRDGALGNDRLQLLINLLARSFQLNTPLGVELAHQDARLIELTEQQMRVLDLLSYRRRAAIQGCADSGKTMLALRQRIVTAIEQLLDAHGFSTIPTLSHHFDQYSFSEIV